MTNKANKKDLVESLQVVIADSYALYLKTQNYHWNVTGPHFKSLHGLFEEQYKELANAIDDIAERIRTLGSAVPATFTKFSGLTTISDGDMKADAMTMVKHLLQDQQHVITTLRQALDKAHALGDEGTVGLLAERVAKHEKNAWMLKVILE